MKKKAGDEHLKKIKMARTKQDYITNLVNARYFLARCNMIAGQIQTKEIKEHVDGCPKDEDYMRAEYALTKLRAINSMRFSHFAKEDLKKEFGLTDGDIEDIEKDYYNGAIIRDDYGENEHGGKKAEFVNESED